MKKIAIILTVLLSVNLMTSCVRSSKTCKKNKRKVQSLRKSGALKM